MILASSSRARLRALLGLAMAAAFPACAPHVPGFSRGGADEWTTTRVSAERSAAARRHGVADSALAGYARLRPGSAEARETLYLRALLQLDPTNPTGSAREGIRMLDEYLADSLAPRSLEASLIRRAAAASDSLTRQVGSLRTAIDAATTRAQNATARDRTDERTDRSREQELQRLREELASTRAELESTRAELDRIKRRLVAPR